MFRIIVGLVLLIAHGFAYADVATTAPVSDLGDLATLNDWSGLQPSDEGATLALAGEAMFRYAEADHGKGDWLDWYGIRLELHLPDDQPVTMDISLRNGKAEAITTKVALTGEGWHTVSLPWSSFALPRTSMGFLRGIREVSIRAESSDGQPRKLTLRDAKIVRGESVWLTTPVRGQSVAAGQTAEYAVTLVNCTNQPQAVTLAFERGGYEAMTPSVEPQVLQLPPLGSGTATVRVQVPSRIPPGGHETQTLLAVANGAARASARLPLITASRLDHPNILHTKEGWDAIRDNVKKYDWAKAARDDNVARAEKWNVPGVANPNNPKRGDWLFRTQVEYDLMAAGIAYQLTLDAKYAEKVRQFMLNLSNPQNGYPVTRRGCHQASVQEGHFFQHIAMAYDMAIPSGLFTEADRQQIDHTLQLFVGPPEHIGGHISNWVVSYMCGQLYCALILQDLSAANHCLYNKGGIIDQLVQGTLDDGWWYEVSISYNIWCATEFSQVALAMRPWGLDLVHRSFPSAFRPNDELSTEEEEYGMSKARWGPIHNPGMNIKRMWDALPPMLDYRGVIFGLNDSSSKPVAGPQMDIAYYLYRDPAYVPVIKRGGQRDLLYAVPELPEGGPDMSRSSAYADNAGVALLRSQTDDRPLREQIQAVLHYGDHGYFHGHFDRTNLLHLSRYGRSFFHPEFIWYGYPNYMYKFYVQTSVSKNMVVVDQKMQEPVESQRLLFHSGKLMQAAAVQTHARWSNPPYGGMVYWDQPHKTFADKAFAEGRSVPIPDNPPPYGKVTDYTEPILQRRLMIVTDDYVVLADYLKGEQEHTFDSLLQMKEFQGLEAAEKKLVRHTGQWNPDPIGSAQFVTDCDWYEVSAPARGSYAFRFGPAPAPAPGGDADNAGSWADISDDGVLQMDVHTLWPAKQEIMIGTPPETHGVQKQVAYTVRGDGNTLTEGRSGMWILGQVEIDVPVEGVRSLELETKAGGSPTLFWANARIVTNDGKEIPILQLPIAYDNTRQPAESGKDFAGGPIKIAGIPYTDALSAQPQNDKSPALVRVDLSGFSGSRFKCVLGGDFPVGDETQRRKTVAQRVVGREARFLTLIEPSESQRMVKHAEALDADTLRVELADGRTQEIQIQHLTGDGHAITFAITETRGGRVVRQEHTTAP